MKSIHRKYLKKITASFLVAVITMSLIMTYDKAGQFCSSVMSVLAEELDNGEDAPADSEAKENEKKAAEKKAAEKKTAEKKAAEKKSAEKKAAETTEAAPAETTAPKTSSSKPAATKPETKETEETKASASKTEETKPAETKPEATKSSAESSKAKPEGTEQSAAKPAESKAEATESAETKNDPTKPSVAEPSATEPSSSEPVGTEQKKPANTETAPSESEKETEATAETTEETKPVESDPQTTETEESVPGESESDQTDPSETESSESESSETEPSETEPTDEDTGLEQRTVKAEGEDIYVSGLLPNDAIVTAERVEINVSGAKVIAAYDIKVFDKEGNEWQPVEPLKIKVASKECNNVTKKDTQVIYVPDEIAESGKPVDIKNKDVEKIDATVKKGNVEFEAEHFSVYVIIEHEGGDVVTPRVQFHFISAFFGDASTDGTTTYYSVEPYTFTNKHGDNQTTQILKNGESLELIKDPVNSNEKFFYGWYLASPYAASGTNAYGLNVSENKIYYTMPENPAKIPFEQPISITQSGNVISWTLGSASGTGTADADGNVHVLVAPVYENYHFVNFMQFAHDSGAGSSASNLMTRKLLVFGGASSAEVKVSDVVATSTDSVRLIFKGWEYYDGTHWVQVETIDYNGNELKDPGKDGKYITVTGNIDLYPIFIEARWADFNVGISGNGATYVESRYLMAWNETGDNASLSEIEGKSILTKLDAPTRKGYDFGGWYADVENYNASTGEFTRGKQITDTTITDGKVSVLSGTTITGTEGGNKAWEVSDGKLRFYYGLSRLTLYAKWIPAACNISVVYWTENVQDKDYVAPADPKDDYTSAAVKTITTTDLNAQLGTSYASGSTLPRSALEGFQVNSVSILDRQYLDEAGAVPQGEEKFYDLDADLSDSSVVINGDGTTVINVFFKRKVFKLVFHIGRDGYVKNAGHQKSDTDWDGNWLEFMFKDQKVTDLGYPKAQGTKPGFSYPGTYSMTYNGHTYDSTYVTTNANVMGDYDPADDEANLYVIKAKYGAYIGDRWPSPVNPNFTFNDTPSDAPGGQNVTLYIWAAYYGSLYHRIAQERSTAGNEQGANPDINGVYQYMSAELCSNRAGDDIINKEQVHHLVAWFGPKNNNKRFKQYHILYEAIPGTYDPNTVHIVSGNDYQYTAHIVSGNDYQSYNLTTWSQEHTAGDKSEIAGRNFIELSDSPRFLISKLEPQFQLIDTPDGYELFYSCYNPTQVTNPNISGQKDYHIYFFFRPKQYNLTFMYENEADRKTDTYYYTQSLADANKYDPPSRTGYEFLGWYTNEAGIGEPFDFANSTMPAANVLLYPVLRALKYKVEIDPNGGEIDHINHNETSSYDGSGRGAFNRGVLYKLDPVTGQQVLDDQNQPIVERPADSGYRRDQSTYFNGTYGERIGQYTLSPKNYVQLSDKDAATYRGHVYYYVNMQYKDTDGGERGLPSDLRNALYVTETELSDLYDFYYKVAEANKNNGSRPDITLLSFDQWKATYVSTQKYRHITESEHWTFMGWYRVYDNGSEASMPYNFNDPVYGEIKLRAKWRLDGGIYIKYNSYFFVEENGQFTAVIGDIEQRTDPALPATQLYADQSLTNILRAPTHVTENWVFRGWRVVRPDGNSSMITVNGRQYRYQQWTPIQFDENGNPIYYSPGDDFTVNSALVTQTDGYGGIIHMQAYYEHVSDSYRRPDVTNLILDANKAHDGYVNETDSTLLPALSGPGSSIINTTDPDHMDGSHPTQILLGDFQSNISLHLYRYATTKAFNEITGKNFFTHKNGYLLLGFDENSNPNNPTTTKPYIPAYAADSVIAVTRNDARTLYAMWEPMVYVTFVNTTDKEITINLSGSGNSTISIVNKATGEFDREAATSTIKVPAKSGDVNGEVKIVLPGAIPGTDTVTATAINDHSHKKMSVSGKFDTTDPYGTGSDLIPYGGSVTYTGTLMTDSTGIIVTYIEEPAKQVIYDVNGGVWTETSTDYYHASGDLYTLDEDKIVNNSYHPSDPTRSNKIFIGWTTNADIAAHTDFSSDTAVTWGSTTITPDSGSNVLDKIRSSYLWDFSQQPPYNQTLYAVWSDTVTVTFDICYTSNENAATVYNHIWNGPATVSENVPYEFCANDPKGRYITYSMVKGETVPMPQDPSAYAGLTNAYFFKWLIYSSTVDSYRYNTKNPQDGNLSATSSYIFDFTKRVNSDTKLITSWIKTEPQIFTFTIENHVTGGSADEEFDYTIAVSGEQVDKSNKLTNVDNQWGSVTTKLKNGQTYTVQIKVCFDPTLWDGCYSATMEVIDRDGNVIKSSPLLKHSTLSKKYFTTSCKYTLSISQTAKTGYDTTLEDGASTGTIIHDTNSANRTFTFTVMHGSKFDGSNQNEYVAGDNSLTLIFTNRGSALVTPTGVASNVHPYALLLASSLLLVPVVLKRRRRKKEEN